MIETPFVHDVQTRTGVETEEQAWRAIDATLHVLGQCIPGTVTEALAQALSVRLAGSLRQGETEGGLSEEDAADVASFYAKVGQLEGVRVGFGVEHAQVVCQVLAERIPDDTLEYARSQMAADLAALLQPRPVVDPAPRHGHTWLQAHHRSLATGHPGGCHPLSETESPVAHRHSVVRSSNPHADTKLSSGRGTSQEREERTLSTGRPGGSHPITDDEG